MDSRRSLLSYDGLDASRALAFFNDEAVEQDEESLFLWMRAHPYDDLVVLDVTASQQLADQYLDFASHGFHVISANKLAGASDSNKYRNGRCCRLRNEQAPAIPHVPGPVQCCNSRWYRDNPLVIRGPGAGRDVTAGAIQSDINRLAQLL